MDQLTLSIIIFAIGILVLLFGKTLNPMTDVVGFICLITGFLMFGDSCYNRNQCNHPKVDLPEEYKEITVKDTLRGYLDNKGVLHIEFNNKRNQK